MRATVSAPIQQAEALSGWCSRMEASPTMRSFFQRRCPKCTASAIPAKRAAADDPQRRDLAVLRFEHLAVGSDDEMVLHPCADLRVAAFGGNEEVGRALGSQ